MPQNVQQHHLCRAADLERAMAVLSPDLVRHGLALCPKMTTDVNEQNTRVIGLDGLNKK
jgi:hypothetical protein